MTSFLSTFEIPDWLTATDVSLLCLVCAVLFGLWVLACSDRVQGRKLPPGPRGFPIVGSLPFLSRDAPYQTLTRWAKRYGRIYSVRLGSVRAVVLSDPRIIRQAFGKDAFSGKPPLPVTYGVLGGYGVFGAEGRIWREQRRFLTDAFRTLGAHRHSPQKEVLDQKIAAEVDDCLKEFAARAGQPFNCEPIVSFAMGNVICQVIFGRRFPLGDEEFKRVLEDVALGFKMVGVVGAINFLPFLRFVPFFRRAFDQLKAMQKEHHIFLRRMVARAKEGRGEADQPRQLIDLFLQHMDDERGQEESTFSEPQLIQLLGDLLGAGMETSAQTLQWLLLYVASSPDVQAQIHEELDRVVGRDRQPEMEDLPQLPYLEATILETQRLCSLVPLGAPHGTTQAMELDGFLIPQNTMVMALLWFVSSDDTFWGADANQFNPQRFLDENGSRKATPDAFLPFSAGRRMCPGDDLARRELFLFASAIFQQFSILPAEGAKEALNMAPDMGFTLTPQPFKIQAVSRNT